MIDFDDLDEVAPARRLFDIVVYGATGYTGCLVVEHLDALLSQPGAVEHRWAIAGRSLDKLEKLARRCKSAPKAVCAATPAQLQELAADCHVMISLAGPYLECGEEVVRACVQQHTHYVDVTGEVNFMHRMITRYHAAARENGVMIVHAAAAMAAPDDACAYLLAKKLGPLSLYREYAAGFGMQGGGSFSTGLAVVEQMIPDTMKVYSDPFCLGGQRSCGVRAEDQDCKQEEQDTLFPSLWAYPGYSTHTNARVLRRTVHLFDEAKGAGVHYGDKIVIAHRELAFDQKSAAFAIFSNPIPVDIKDTVRQTRTMEELRKRGMAAMPGCGAPEALRTLGCFELIAVAQGENGDWAHAHLKAPEGYETTAMAAVVGALVLLEETDAIDPKTRGGVLTPAFAFHGSTWIERLQAQPFANQEGRKLSIEVKDGLPNEEDVKATLAAVGARRKAGGDLIGAGVKPWDKPALLSA